MCKECKEHLEAKQAEGQRVDQIGEGVEQIDCTQAVLTDPPKKADPKTEDSTDIVRPFDEKKPRKL